MIDSKVLERHGLVTWGESGEESYEATIEEKARELADTWPVDRDVPALGLTQGVALEKVAKENPRFAQPCAEG